MDVFGITIEFDHDEFRRKISLCQKDGGKGYVCVVDANVLGMTYVNEAYRDLVKGAYVNTCDGSSIASMVNRIYRTNYSAFNGPDVFAEYVIKSEYKQLLIGNTQEKFDQIRNILISNGKDVSHLSYFPLPYVDVDGFDYQAIAEQINQINPDLIWVSLGAPKQELFMARILPFINRGLMFGVGAVFNFYVGDIAQPKFHIGSLRFIWLDRILKEPKKQLKRVFNILKVYPKLFREEKRRHYNKKKK